MKRSELLFNVLLVPLDFLVILMAGIVAYELRTSRLLQTIRAVAGDFSLVDMLPFVLAFAGLSVVWFALSGLYNMRVTRTALRELYILFLSVSTTVLVFVLYFFFERELFSRSIIIFMWGLSILFVFAGRLLMRGFQRFLSEQYGVGVHRLALIGAQTDPGRAITDMLGARNAYGYRVVYTSSAFQEEELASWARTDAMDEIMVCDPAVGSDTLEAVNRFCERHHLVFQYTPTLFEAYPKLQVHHIAGVLLFKVKQSSLDGWASVIKRLFDIAFAGVFLIVFSPVYLVLSLAIKLDSRGPVIYKNERVGREGRRFLLWKFRTMKYEYCTSEDNSEALEYERRLIEEQSVKEGPIYKIKNDPRVTGVGNFLRKTSLDELPQFINVLKGEMSVVGPRPHQPREVEQYADRHHKLLSVKPGITGLAQISGRSDLSFEEEVLYDIFYIEHWSLSNDIKIIIKTPFAMLMSREVD
jgi:exopolysaccharide biosynthesis polyprenyl glycosylphosphotransferase